MGIPETPIENVLIENVTAHCKNLIRLQDVDGFTLRNMTIYSRDSLITIDDSRNVLFDRVKFEVPGGKVETDIKGDLSVKPEFTDCTYGELKAADKGVEK